MASSRDSEARLGLVEYLLRLQGDLSKARASAAADNLTFGIDRVTVEVDIFYQATEPSASDRDVPEFWILDSGPVDDDQSGRNRQHLLVQLSSRPDSADVGEPGDVAMTPFLPPGSVKDAE